MSLSGLSIASARPAPQPCVSVLMVQGVMKKVYCSISAFLRYNLLFLLWVQMGLNFQDFLFDQEGQHHQEGHGLQDYHSHPIHQTTTTTTTATTTTKSYEKTACVIWSAACRPFAYCSIQSTKLETMSKRMKH